MTERQPYFIVFWSVVVVGMLAAGLLVSAYQDFSSAGRACRVKGGSYYMATGHCVRTVLLK